MLGQLRTDRRPLYVQAVEALKILIATTPYRPGDQLPAETALSKQLGISRTTLRMALGHLEMQGFIRRQQGVGTFVASSAEEQLIGGLQFLDSVQSLAASAGLATKVIYRAVQKVPAEAAWASKLNVPPTTLLTQVDCTVAVDDRPVAHLASLIPADVVTPDELSPSSGSLLEFLLARGVPSLAYTHSRLFAVIADTALAARLEISEGQPLIHLVETYFAQDDEPVALSFNYFVADRFSFYIRRQILTIPLA